MQGPETTKGGQRRQNAMNAHTAKDRLIRKLSNGQAGIDTFIGSSPDGFPIIPTKVGTRRYKGGPNKRPSVS